METLTTYAAEERNVLLSNHDMEGMEAVIEEVVRELKVQGAYVDKAATGKSGFSGIDASDPRSRISRHVLRD
jgi:hypothetical protein